jgi:hypothetical protein
MSHLRKLHMAPFQQLWRVVGLLVTIAFVLPLGVLESRAQKQGSPPKVETAPRRGAAREAVTTEELRKQREGAPKLDALMKRYAKTSTEPRPAPKRTLLSRFIILSDGKQYTLIPLGSILHLPEAHRARVLAKPHGTFAAWPIFLDKNAGWLAAKEIPLAMAKGDEKAAERVLSEISADRRMLVSVHKGGPITVLESPPVAPETEGATNANTDRKESKYAN